MNWLDWLLVVIMAFSAWRGFSSGFIAGVARLLGLVLGLAAAFAGYKTLAGYLEEQWNWGESLAAFIQERLPHSLIEDTLEGTGPGNLLGLNPGNNYLPGEMINDYTAMAAREMAGSVLELLSFVILALAVYIVVNIMMRAISGAANHSLLAPLDRMGGLVLGLARGALVVIIVAALLNPVYSAGAVAGEAQPGFLGRAVAGSVVLPYAQAVVEYLKLQFPGWPLFGKPVRLI